MSSLREKLARKRANSAERTYPVGPEGEAAKAELASAENALQFAKLVPGDGRQQALKEAEERLEAAKAAYADNSVTIRVRGLTEDERDALMTAHPRTPEQEAKDKELPEDQRSDLDTDGFLAAALAVCAVDSDLTEEEWAVELASTRWTAGEKSDLFGAVVTATNAEPGPGIPKG